MAQASEDLEFEKAARLRDDIGALRRAMERQAVVLGGGTDADVVAFADDELEAAVQVFHVRGGRVRGQRGWVIDKVEPTDTAHLVERFLTQFYGEQAALAEASDDAHQPVPKEIIVPELPAEVDVARRVAVGAARVAGERARARSAATSGRSPRPSPATPPKPSPSTSCAAPATSPRARRPLRRSRTRSGWIPLRCGSSASTSRTCRAPTWSPRSSCSRTGWPASPSTAGSRSATARRAATSPRSPKSCAGGSGATSPRPAASTPTVHARSPIAIPRRVTSAPPRSRDPVTPPTWTTTPTPHRHHDRVAVPSGHRPRDGTPPQVRLPAEPAGRRRWTGPGRGGVGRAGRARRHRRRRVRPRQAP